MAETYVLRQENVRLPYRKPRKHKGSGQSSHQHFQIKERLKGKQTELVQEKQAGADYGKDRKNGLQKNVQKNRPIKTVQISGKRNSHVRT